MASLDGLTVVKAEFGSGSAAFSPDGSSVVFALAKTARIWKGPDFKDPQATGQIEVLRCGSVANSAAYSPDGTRIVTASDDNTVRIWDAATAQQIAVLRHQHYLYQGKPQMLRVMTATYSPDGTRIVTTVQWLYDEGQRRDQTRAGRSRRGDGPSTGGEARIWDVASGREIAVLLGKPPAYKDQPGSNLKSAAYSPDGKHVVTAYYGIATIWDVATAKQIATLSGHADWVNSAAFSRDGTRIVTASGDKTARIWDAATAKQITVLSGHVDAVNSAAFSSDGTRIVTASADKTARLWDAAAAKAIAVLSGHEDSVNSAAFNPDGTRIITASTDETARIWDTAAAKEIAILQGHTSSVHSSAFSPDGTRIVTASDDQTVRIWKAQ